MAVNAAEFAVQLTANNQAQNVVNGLADSFLNLPTAARVGIAAAAASVAVLTKAVFSLGQSFDDTYDGIRIGTGATGDALEELKDTFRGVVADVPTDFATAGEAIASLSTLTGATGESLEALTEQVLNASRVMGEDGTATAELYGQALRQWNLSAEEGVDNLDALVAATQQYGVPLNQLISQTTEYGVVLQNAGLDMLQTADFFGRLEAGGIAVSRVMPGLNQAFRRWAAANLDIASTLDETIKAIRDATTDAEGLVVATDAFGAEGAQRLSVAIRSGMIPDLEAWGATLVDAQGTIEGLTEATDDAAETWALAWNRIGLAFEPIAATVFDAVANFAEATLPAFASAIEQAGDDIGGFTLAWDALDTVMDASVGIISKTADELDQLARSTRTLNSLSSDFIADRIDSIAAGQREVEQLQELATFLAAVAEGQDEGRRAGLAAADAAREQATAVEEAVSGWFQLGEATDDGNSVLESTLPIFFSTVLALREYEQGLIDAANAKEIFINAGRGLGRALAREIDALLDAEEDLQRRGIAAFRSTLATVQGFTGTGILTPSGRSAVLQGDFESVTQRTAEPARRGGGGGGAGVRARLEELELPLATAQRGLDFVSQALGRFGLQSGDVESILTDLADRGLLPTIDRLALLEETLIDGGLAGDVLAEALAAAARAAGDLDESLQPLRDMAKDLGFAERALRVFGLDPEQIEELVGRLQSQGLLPTVPRLGLLEETLRAGGFQGAGLGGLLQGAANAPAAGGANVRFFPTAQPIEVILNLDGEELVREVIVPRLVEREATEVDVGF